MRILYFLTICLAVYSCNNNLTTIGEDLIGEEGFVQVKEFKINEISTVKIDSFATSAGYATGDDAVNILLMGIYSDVITGITTATPYFQIAPNSKPNIASTYTLDSVTLNFKYSGKLWGDTINNPVALQTFELWQLKERPELNYDDRYLFYNNFSLPKDSLLSTLSFIPLVETMSEAHFKLKDSFGEKLFEMIQEKDAVFDDTWTFINYFKGLAIVPKAENTCLIGINATSGDLYLRFHFHQTDEEETLDFPLTKKELQFNNIQNIPTPTFASLQNHQERSVPFSDANNIAVAQGVSGYMIKLNLPEAPAMEQYTTIVKAEIELNPKTYVDQDIPNPSTINVYTTNSLNELKGILVNPSTQKSIVGQFIKNPVNTEDERYIFDVTDYYQYLSQRPPQSEDNNEVLLSIPAWTTSFDQLIVDEIPVLKIYYATYK